MPRVPVLLVPGLMAADWAMRPLSHRLRREGYVTYRAQIGFNVGCTADMVGRLEQRLEAIAREHGAPVALVGHSRGGTLAKLLTLRRPELVAALIALAAPNVDPLAVSRSVDWQLRMLNRLRAAGFVRFLGADCLSGDCAESFRQELDRPFPPDVPYTMLYSKHDGVVDWQACCDPDAELVEVAGSHMRVAMSSDVLRRVVATLDRVAVAPALPAAYNQPSGLEANGRLKNATSRRHGDRDHGARAAVGAPRKRFGSLARRPG